MNMIDKDKAIIGNNEYQNWLNYLCEEIDKQRLKAVMQLNAATLQHYWWLGNDIIQKQKEQGWGAKVIDQLSVDLQKRYGGDSGYSSRNLGYMKNFAKEYPDFPFLQVPLAKLQEMPILQARLAKFTVSTDGEFVQVPLAQIFKPEILSKLNYYISAIDDLVKMPEDNPTIGLLLCRTKNNTKVEYALRGMPQPLGVAEYQTNKMIEELKSELPSIDDLENPLND